MPARRTKSTPRTKSVRRYAPAPAQRSPTLPEVWERFTTQLQQRVNDLDTDDRLIVARKRELL
ncbi:MAG: hypothetical protein Q8K55_06030 [Gemmatimonadaceae bacterium]|nr:hypothetical protein [Gemmatimonadaceae bacterium]